MKAAALSILQRAREILRRRLNAPRGELARAEMSERRDLQAARRHLERNFPMLGSAENQWAANRFLQEAARRDKKKGCRRPRGLAKGDGKGREAAGSSQRSAHGGLDDGRDVEAFGEGFESQEASAGILAGLINGLEESQPRGRIAPTTARRR